MLILEHCRVVDAGSGTLISGTHLFEITKATLPSFGNLSKKLRKDRRFSIFGPKPDSYIALVFTCPMTTCSCYKVGGINEWVGQSVAR